MSVSLLIWVDPKHLLRCWILDRLLFSSREALRTRTVNIWSCCCCFFIQTQLWLMWLIVFSWVKVISLVSRPRPLALVLVWSGLHWHGLGSDTLSGKLLSSQYNSPVSLMNDEDDTDEVTAGITDNIRMLQPPVTNTDEMNSLHLHCLGHVMQPTESGSLIW